ncbi:MAG: type II toxin-antitoxin system prevent-host-death family antitoxin [Roseiflexus castenholzii]|uniref:type II toxin-antitoxin system prevent-host-death family antitoxin n=1 Tax=Roseiflexus castenholzii TaxID=120962 RepID=UPI000CB97121|nr:MAG: type II toxin-antitoxin system prevent-host-death family antitoxin [Roseiflexus castenholzii]
MRHLQSSLVLLARVRQGERIITFHGTPVAILAPVEETSTRPYTEVIAELRAFRKGRRLSGTTTRELIEEGRS